MWPNFTVALFEFIKQSGGSISNSDSRWVSPRQVFQSLRGPSSEKFQIFFPKSRPLEGSEYKILGHFTQPFSRYEFLNFGAFRPFQTWQRRGRAREKHETVLV